MGGLFQLNIVTLRNKIFSGAVKRLFIRGIEGELEILFGHSPLLTLISPGPVWFNISENKEKGFLILGGLLEVRQDITTILADSLIESKNINEKNSLQARKSVEIMFQKKGGQFGL